MRNPNGYGSVVHLSGNRRRPYMVRKTAGWDDRGYPIYQIIGYAATREEGNILLAEYNRSPWDVDQAKITLQQLYDMWTQKKASKLGKSNREALAAAYNHIKTLADCPYREIKAYMMQETIDNCDKVSMQAKIKALWGHLDLYCKELDISVQQYSGLLHCQTVPDAIRRPFSGEEIQLLWEHADTPWADTVLILLYSGWRISELLGLRPEDVDTTEWTMIGGVKTAAGKNRIVPVHTRIRPLVQRRLDDGGERLIASSDGGAMSITTYRRGWYGLMDALGMSHVPHECRHTFETRLDDAGANRKCIDLLMGHASKDVGNRVYNHKTLDQLRETIALLN